MGLLGEADLRRYLTARLVSVGGTVVMYVVLPVLVYRITRSNLWTAFVVAAKGLPYLCFGPFAGALADRVDPQRLMAAAGRTAVGRPAARRAPPAERRALAAPRPRLRRRRDVRRVGAGVVVAAVLFPRLPGGSAHPG